MEHKFVSVIDVLQRIGWLPQARVDEWRQGRLPYLEAGIQVNPHNLSTAMDMFRRWAQARGLTPSETGYVSRTRDRHLLRCSNSGDDALELAYRTHWVSPELSTAKRERIRERESRAPDMVVISPLHDWTCSKCAQPQEGEFLLMQDAGPTCRRCAGLDHLVFLAAGDATLSRRAKSFSSVSAIVVRFSRSRKRYERQGILVEESALESARQQRG